MPSSRERVAYRKAHGLCVWCGAPIPEDCGSRIYCKKHFKRTKERRAQRPENEQDGERYGAKHCSYYSAAVAEICLNCAKERCTDLQEGCKEYREALKSVKKTGGCTWTRE